MNFSPSWELRLRAVKSWRVFHLQRPSSMNLGERCCIGRLNPRPTGAIRAVFVNAFQFAQAAIDLGRGDSPAFAKEQASKRTG